MRGLSGLLTSFHLPPLGFYLKDGKLTVLSMGLLAVPKTNPGHCISPGGGTPTLNKCQGQRRDPQPTSGDPTGLIPLLRH